MNQFNRFVDKRTYLLVFSLIIAFFFLQSQAQRVRYFTRIGCVDLQKLVESISKNPNLCKILSLDANSISKIQQIQTRITEQNNQLQNLSPESKEAENAKQKLEKLQEELVSFKKNFNYNSSSYYRSYLSEAAYKNIFKEIKNLALKQGFSLILEKDTSVLYVEDDVDLTNQIIQIIQRLDY